MDQPISLITGASRGLGLATAQALAGRGHRVLLTARRADQGQAAADALAAAGHAVAFRPLDVTDADAVTGLAAWVRDQYGRLDVLVNNAGVFLDAAPGTPAASALVADHAIIRSTFETNTLGPLRLCQALIPLMDGRGRVVNVSSGLGQLADMNGSCVAYRLSKVGLNAVTRILADELRGTGIKVNSVCPGWVRTAMGGPNALREIDEGISGIVWAATLSDDGPTGGFFRDGLPIPW